MHALLVASEFTAEAVAQQAAKLTFQQVEQMQVSLQRLRDAQLLLSAICCTVPHQQMPASAYPELCHPREGGLTAPRAWALLH